MAGVPTPPPPLCKAHADVRLSAAIRTQVRNGAWQPWACTRLPECNFPIITLPSFSASVKDHPGTQRSRACWQKDRPSLQITLHWWRKPTRPGPDSGNVQCLQETGPACPVDLVILSLCRDLHLLAPRHPQSLSSAAGMLPIATLPIWIPGAYSVTDSRCPYRVTHHTVGSPPNSP